MGNVRNIGAVCQDAISYGLLLGLKQRMGCEAEIKDAPSRIGSSRQITARNAKLTWRTFQNQSVDVVVRLTDADGHRFQDVRREEVEMFPEEIGQALVCGVCVDNVEQVLARAQQYLSSEIGVQVTELADAQQNSDKIKSALKTRANSCGMKLRDYVAQLVAEAPPDVFSLWLADEAFADFYRDCRAAAIRNGCRPPNELD